MFEAWFGSTRLVLVSPGLTHLVSPCEVGHLTYLLSSAGAPIIQQSYVSFILVFG